MHVDPLWNYMLFAGRPRGKIFPTLSVDRTHHRYLRGLNKNFPILVIRMLVPVTVVGNMFNLVDARMEYMEVQGKLGQTHHIFRKIPLSFCTMELIRYHKSQGITGHHKKIFALRIFLLEIQ